MNIVHISDTHLGFSAYTKVDPATGVNQRESDFYDAFVRCVDRVIELDPDLLIHSGDLFDTVRPQNRAIDLALKQLVRLSDAGIEVVLISGNHSTPRLAETGNIFRIFEHLDNVHPIHEPGVTALVCGDITVHAIPHSANPPMTESLAQVRTSRNTKHNILALHAGVDGANTYKMDEFNEQIIAPDQIPTGMDYVALGHYHRYSKVREMMYYSGATERSGFGEVGQRKGFIEVDLESRRVEFHEVATRTMKDLPSIDAKGLTATDVASQVRSRLDGEDTDGIIARLVVSQVGADAMRSLDIPALRRLGSSALFFELKIGRADTASHIGSGSTTIGTLAKEYQLYVDGLQTGGDKKQKLLDLGLPYFAEG
ncbi:TPA: exonuclease SbcCD subunit D [Thermoplasmata archaeon]|nr:exonuclease SbcCD subunit D [Thermoplasmata archaeon]